MAESRPVGIETNGYMRRVLFFQHLLERVAKPEHSRSIEPVGGNPRRTYKGIIRPVNQRIRVEQEKFFIIHLLCIPNPVANIL